MTRPIKRSTSHLVGLSHKTARPHCFTTFNCVDQGTEVLSLHMNSVQWAPPKRGKADTNLREEVQCYLQRNFKMVMAKIETEFHKQKLFNKPKNGGFTG